MSELLESNLLFELGFYYNELSGMGDKLVRYGEFTESEVLPRLKPEDTNFYDENLELLPPFSVVAESVERSMNRAAAMRTVADEVDLSV